MHRCLAPPLRNNALLARAAFLLLHTFSAVSEDVAPVMLVDNDWLQAESQGWVVVYYNGEWGWACDPGWTLGTFEVVACRQLGFAEGGQMWAGRRLSSGAGSGVPMLGQSFYPVSCNGTESALSECESGGQGEVEVGSCQYRMGVSCLGTRTPTPATSTALSSTPSATVTSTPWAMATLTFSATAAAATAPTTVEATAPVAGWFDPGALLERVGRHEDALVNQLLSGNASRVEANTPEGVIVVQRVVVQDIPAKGSVRVALSDTSAEVSVPRVAFSQLGLEDAVLVVTGLHETVSMATGRGGTPGAASVEVRGAVNLNVVSATTGKHVSVRGLVDPVSLRLPASWSLGARARCTFWDEPGSVWSTEGLVDGEQSQEREWIVCYTTHFTLFGAIVEGLVSSLECAQVILLSVDAVRELIRGDWYRQAAAIALWLALTFLLVLMAIACHLERQRAHGKLWDDEQFLIPQDRTAEAYQAAALLANNRQANSSSGRAGQAMDLCPVRACHLVCVCLLLPLRCFAHCWRFDAVREAVDDLMESFVEYFGEIRVALRGFRQAVVGEAVEGGRFLALLSSAMSAVMVRNAQLFAGAELRIAHADVRFVMNDETAWGMLVSEAPRTYREADIQVRNKNGMSQDRDARRHVLRLKTYATSSDLEVQRALKLMQLHHAVGERVRLHLQRHSSWRSLPGMTSVLFMMLSPVGSVLVPSIFSTSATRSLLLSCKVVGAVLIVTVFFDAAGDATSKFSYAECADIDNVGRRIGRLIAVGIGSALIAGIPVSLLSCLHSRRFKRFPCEGCPEWHRQLRAWRLQDKVLWVLGTSYVIFGVLFICLFLANVERGNLSEWLWTVSVTILQDALVVPLILAVFGPLFAMATLAVISCWHRSGRGQVIQDHVSDSWRHLGPRAKGALGDRAVMGSDLDDDAGHGQEAQKDGNSSSCCATSAGGLEVAVAPTGLSEATVAGGQSGTARKDGDGSGDLEANVAGGHSGAAQKDGDGSGDLEANVAGGRTRAAQKDGDSSSQCATWAAEEEDEAKEARRPGRLAKGGGGSVVSV